MRVIFFTIVIVAALAAREGLDMTLVDQVKHRIFSGAMNGDTNTVDCENLASVPEYTEATHEQQ